MKKLILTFILIINNAFATDYEINCIGDLEYTSNTIFMLDWYYMGSFYDEDVMYTASLSDYPSSAFDLSSPACGGTGEQNLFADISCNNGDCYDGYRTNTIVGQGLVEPANDGGYITTVVRVNGYPCLDLQNTTLPTRLTYTFYDDDDVGKRLASDFRYGTVLWDTIGTLGQYGDTLTSEEAIQLREICTPPDPNAQIDYRPYLEQIIVNTAPNSQTVDKLTNIDDRQTLADNIMDTATQGKTIESILDVEDDKTSFTTTFENTLTTSYDTYSDVFGFGGYGIAPAPITFSMFEKTYTVFDVTIIGQDNVDLIRNTFLTFAYLFGFIMVFRGN